MPEGLQTSLKPEEFADLIAYLETLKETPAPTKGTVARETSKK